METLMRAIVVEDSRQLAERIVEMISLPGVEVVGTAVGEEQAKALCDRFAVELAVIDLQLDEGTGFGVIRKLREKGRSGSCCILVLTNHAVPALKHSAFEAGADYFLDKSKDFATLPCLVGELLNTVTG